MFASLTLIALLSEPTTKAAKLMLFALAILAGTGIEKVLETVDPFVAPVIASPKISVIETLNT